jgi:hypothetical protein
VSDNLPTITRNYVVGDIAGRDINKFYAPQPALRELAARFRKDCTEDPKLTEFIERLQHFTIASTTSPARTLDEKLSNSGRSDLQIDAKLLKEQFAKKLARFQFSEQAQNAFLHVLCRIQVFFLQKVRPKYIENASRSDIDHMIYTDLLCPIFDEIGTCELDVDIREIQGMIYFLAAHCHISWDDA